MTFPAIHVDDYPLTTESGLWIADVPVYAVLTVSDDGSYSVADVGVIAKKPTRPFDDIHAPLPGWLQRDEIIAWLRNGRHYEVADTIEHAAADAGVSWPRYGEEHRLRLADVV